jgi:endonuclease/exonuclease/phosphatase family metal-dependent hydrolase
MRIATFNIENWDDVPPTRASEPSFAERVAITRPMLARLRADVLLLQEVHGQDEPGAPRGLKALRALLAGTAYEGHQIRSTTIADGVSVERYRNLVTLIPPGWVFEDVREVMHDIVPPPEYKRVTANPPDTAARPIRWERPLFYCRVSGPLGRFHLVNCHFKAKSPTDIPGQGETNFMWASAAGWAEGFFISSMKRVGAALEARMFLDTVFAAEPEARVVLAGDLNAESHEVPVVAVRGDVDEHGNPALNGQQLYPCEDTVPTDRRYTLYHHGRGNMLDHLLVSRALIGAYRGTEIHNEILRDESRPFANDRKYPAPDHAPVVAEFDDALLGA